MSDILYWVAVGVLVWAGLFGILVLFLQGAHRDDDEDIDLGGCDYDVPGAPR
jgi:hypothetical protein